MSPRHSISDANSGDATAPASRRRFMTTTAAAALALAFGRLPAAFGQAKNRTALPLADPRDFTLDFTPGPMRPGDGRNVLCRVDSADEVVARLLVEVGNSRVVMLPNGRVVGLKATETTITDKPFNPATMQQVAAELSGGRFAGFKTRNTKHYLYLYNTSDTFFTAASRIMETMFPGVFGHARGQRMAVRAPEVPMVVVMFATEQQFQAYQRMEAGVAAYYSPLSNYVVMYEHSRMSQLALDIALRQAISTIAHEGAHQILHNIGVQQRLSRWPMWIAEGLAEYFAPTTTDKRLTWKGAGQLNELRLLELDRYLRGRPARVRGDLVQHTVQAAELTSTGYATAWALTHFLAQRQQKKFFAFLKEVSETGPLEGSYRPDNQGRIAQNVAMFARHFGDDMDRLEEQVVEHLKKLLAQA